ncbi:MAG: DUF4198 domain-containing protein [Bacteroidota bacterium]
MRLKINILRKKLQATYCRPIYLVFAILLLCSHDLYLKMETYFLRPNQVATLSLYNGTFETSENVIARDRMLDASVVAQGKRTAINPNQWKDRNSTITQFTFAAGEAGTYVAGVSTKARNIALTAEKFNDYLKHDGILDMLEYRTKQELLDKDAVESYQKHVKAIYQVGDIKTNDWSTILGYPIEFVPQSNPYKSHSGDQLKVQLLLDGQPLSNQLVYANHIVSDHGHHDHDHGNSHGHNHQDDDHSHGHSSKEHAHGHSHDGDGHSHDGPTTSGEEHTHTSGQQLLTNDQGMVMVDLPEDGIYYIRTIHMVNITDNDELTHESKWATLTFEVRHEHNDNNHDHEHELPTWVFVVGSLLIIGLLFFIFKKKNNEASE